MNKKELRELDRIRRVYRHEFRLAANRQKLMPEKMQDALEYCERYFVIGDHGVPVTVEGHKEVEAGLSIDELLIEFQERNSHWWPKAQGAGAIGSSWFSAGQQVVPHQETAKVDEMQNAGEKEAAISLSVDNSVPELSDQKSKNYHRSDELTYLIQASDKFWKNADQADTSTHPKNKQVVEWLKVKGLTTNKAEVSASIIRPIWAATGRRAEE